MSAIKALTIAAAPASLLLSACSAEVMTAFVDGMAGTSSSPGRTSSAERRQNIERSQQEMLDEIRRAEAQQRHQQTTGSSARPATTTPRPATTTTRPATSTTRPATSTTRPAATSEGFRGYGNVVRNVTATMPPQRQRIRDFEFILEFRPMASGRSGGDHIEYSWQLCNRSNVRYAVSAGVDDLQRRAEGMPESAQGMSLDPGACRRNMGGWSGVRSGASLRPNLTVHRAY